MNNIVHNVDYKFVLTEGVKDRTCIEIMQGPYKGIVFSFNNIKMPELDLEEETSEEIVVQFDFDIYEYVNYKHEDLTEDVNFQQYMGTILHDLLEKAVERLMDNDS